ncbi:hypothetical protein [Roseibium sp.]|uniref:hypothetical protein n=1 Tax=Roseibium sp. TaxID=1936156 RepID=UPI003A987492
MQTWMLTITGRKKYWGNKQYGNDPARTYSYDSFVQNHKAISIDDVVLVREGDWITGLSRIDGIHQQRGNKLLQECPVCGSRRIRKREKIIPPWKCEYGHQFDAPVILNRKVVTYTADFENRYVELPKRVDWRKLQNSFSNKSALSIRKVSAEALLEAADPELGVLQDALRNFLNEVPVADRNHEVLSSAAAKSKAALMDLEDFLAGCKANDDVDPRHDNKLTLPLNGEQLNALHFEIGEIREQLDDPLMELDVPKEPSFVFQQTRSFLTEFIKSAGKTAGALAAAGTAAKLLGLLDAAVVALQTLAQ